MGSFDFNYIILAFPKKFKTIEDWFLKRHFFFFFLLISLQRNGRVFKAQTLFISNYLYPDLFPGNHVFPRYVLLL